ncbi:MAG: polyphosphate polymerase domain-containing protein [Clostridia bacterium]|nr:polyphosphate polymerase domain-containing protein [Clostridia bacterium]
MNTFKRMEKKTTMQISDVPAFLERILPRMDYDSHNVNGEPYMISNIYFDDVNDNVIRTSVTLPKYKEKLRLRSYGVPTSDTKVFLELKKKLYGVGTKRRAKLLLRDAEAYLETGTHPEGLSYIDEQVLREIDYYRSHETVVPRIYVSYLRRAFFAKDDPSFRVTLDSDILTRRYDLDLSLGRYGEPVLSPGKLVLEVKFAGAVPLWFCRVMSDFGLSFHTFSKCGTDFKLYTYEKACAERMDEAHYLRLIH